MATFSIKDIEAVSGIRCHTLRIWEQRYGIIQPKRTESNIRYYDEDDLKSILNISVLNKQGYKISEIARMSRDEVNAAIRSISCPNGQCESQIKNLVTCMLAFDEHGFHGILNKAILQMGFEQTMLSIVFPFLIETGIMWQVGSLHPSHEHFASNIIKQKLYVAIDGNVGKYTPNRKRFLLFLPEHEQHSMGLLFANYVLRSRGHDVLFLGQEVPFKDFKETMKGHQPDYIFTILTSSCADLDKQAFMNDLAGTWPNSQILLSGIQCLMFDAEIPKNVSIIKRMEDFITFANQISSTPNHN